MTWRPPDTTRALSGRYGSGYIGPGRLPSSGSGNGRVNPIVPSGGLTGASQKIADSGLLTDLLHFTAAEEIEVWSYGPDTSCRHGIPLVAWYGNTGGLEGDLP